MVQLQGENWACFVSHNVHTRALHEKKRGKEMAASEGWIKIRHIKWRKSTSNLLKSLSGGEYCTNGSKIQKQQKIPGQSSVAGLSFRVPESTKAEGNLPPPTNLSAELGSTPPPQGAFSEGGEPRMGPPSLLFSSSLRTLPSTPISLVIFSAPPLLLLLLSQTVNTSHQFWRFW
jgi:hypothetical protein